MGVLGGVMLIKEKGEKLSLNLVVESSLSDAEKLILQKAARHIVSVMNSREFAEFVLNYRYSYRACRGILWWKRCWTNKVDGFNWNDSLNNMQIYNKLMTGSEELRPEADNEIDINLVIDRRNKRGVLGYTYPNSIKQWIYSWFLNSDYKAVAGNLVHEWCHKMGFNHAFKYHYTRQFTVPYAVGYYIRDAKGYFEK